MRLVLLALALSTSCAPANESRSSPSATPEYVGVWAKTKKDCRRDPDMDQRITVTARSETGYEYRCKYLSVTADKTGWVIKAQCTGEGETTIEHSRRDVLSDGTTMVTNAYGETIFVRCR